MMYGIAQKEQLGFDVRRIPTAPGIDSTLIPFLCACAESGRGVQCAVRFPWMVARLLTRVPCCAEYRMSRYGVTPNMMIMPPQDIIRDSNRLPVHPC